MVFQVSTADRTIRNTGDWCSKEPNLVPYVISEMITHNSDVTGCALFWGNITWGKHVRGLAEAYHSGLYLRAG